MPHWPAAPIALAAAIIVGWATGKVGIASEVAITPGMPQLVIPSWPELSGRCVAAALFDTDQCRDSDGEPVA